MAALVTTVISFPNQANKYTTAVSYFGTGIGIRANLLLINQGIIQFRAKLDVLVGAVTLVCNSHLDLKRVVLQGISFASTAQM